MKRNRRSITCTGSEVFAVMLLLIAMPTKGGLACIVADRQRWSVQRLWPWSLLNVATSGPLTRCWETGPIDTRCDSVSPTVVVHSVLIVSPYYRSRHPELPRTNLCSWRMGGLPITTHSSHAFFIILREHLYESAHCCEQPQRWWTRAFDYQCEFFLIGSLVLPRTWAVMSPLPRCLF